ncbi:MAG: DUF1549 domain-containing protein [Polyangiaceae bacterium]|jgi:hypothetical protein|nr:DUF1549 domain-containing protein [Polyangiaceae bacterium]
MSRIPLLLLPLALLAAACDSGSGSSLNLDDGSDGNDGSDGSDGNDGSGAGTSEGGGAQGGGGPGIDPALADREVDYNEALRTASLKLIRRLPTLAQIKAVKDAADPKAAYTAELDAMLASPDFNARMVKFWRDTMRMGGDGLDTAPAFAAKLMAEGRPFSELFTATTGNCPTYDGATGTFTDADCASGAPVQAGVLTDPAVQRQFYGNMAFRRLRWVQETFYCTKMPAEVADQPTQIDSKDYTAPWPFESVATAPINFQDTQSVVCANCHATMNRAAPLFANFGEDGMWNNNIAVMTPIAPEPVTTELSHWLNPGVATAWRNGVEVSDLAQLGQALAEDPQVGECVVARVWNFAMSKEDIVADLATVPFGVVEPHITKFDTNGQDLKAVLRDILLSEDFVSF